MEEPCRSVSDSVVLLLVSESSEKAVFGLLSQNVLDLGSTDIFFLLLYCRD